MGMPDTTENLRELVYRLQAADEQAFRTLYDLYQAKLYWFCLSFVKTEALAEELVQEVFVQLWEKKHTLNAELSINAYLYTSVKNRLVNHFKKNALIAAHARETRYLLPEACSDAEKALEYGDYLSLAHTAIAKLPPQRQLIFRMSREQELSHQQIAASLGISKNTVKVQVVKALKSIRAFLGLSSEALPLILAGFVLL